MRAIVHYEWKHLETDSDPRFLKFAPEIFQARSEQLVTTTNIDDVTAIMESEETRITPASNLRSLGWLRNHIYIYISYNNRQISLAFSFCSGNWGPLSPEALAALEN